MFVIVLKTKDIDFLVVNNGHYQLPIEDKIQEEYQKARIRGVFMGSGSINNPEKEYHLEVDVGTQENLKIIVDMLEKFEIHVKTFKTSFYIKDGEEISKFLALIGAGRAVLKFEEIRIQKEMRGKVNRLVNCETANLNKTINASIEQIAAIRTLQENGKFHKLEDNLKEIALLRIENPNMSLVELGKLLKEPIGKSGVNYRLKKLIELAGSEK